MMNNSLNSQVKSKWNILSLINWGEKYFSDQNIESPRLNMEYILAKVFDCRRLDLYMQFDKPLNRNELAQVRSMVIERIKGKPLQYILGVVEFYDTVLEVNEGVLIPRPETELLVDFIVKDIKKNHEDDYLNILDLGTGSGNIAIAIAKKINKCKIFAVDISEKALVVARKNASKNGVADKISFFQADIMKDWNGKSEIKFDYIVSNPPYISTGDKNSLSDDIIRYEPHEALFAGKSGTEFYSRIVSCFKNRLINGGKLFMEIGFAQSEPVKKMLGDAGFYDIVIEKDYNKIDRVIYAVH